MIYSWLKVRIRLVFLFLFTSSLCFVIWLDSFSPIFLSGHLGRNAAIAQSVTQSTDVSQLVQTGVERYEAGLFIESTEPWKAAYEIYESTQDFSALAIVSENLARAYGQLGQPAEEIVYWERAIAAQNSRSRTASAVGTKIEHLLIEQAQAYSRSGQNRKAISILCGGEIGACVERSALQIAEETADVAAQVAALGSLGEAYQMTGDTEVAIAYLEKGLSLSKEIDSPILKAAILNGLGNTFSRLAQAGYRRANEAESRGAIEATALRVQAEEDNAQAIAYFQQGYELAVTQQDNSTQVRSLLNLISAEVRVDNVATAQQYATAAITILDQLPASQLKAFALLQLADLIPNMLEAARSPQDKASLSADAETQVAWLLDRALAIGRNIENLRVTSFALGKLGTLDEHAGRYESAIDYTQAARLAASQNASTKDSLYLWDWQMGRVLGAQGKENASTQAYAQAIALLEQIRSETLSTNRDLQLDFRDTVEPVYRQYAALSLKAVPNAVTLQRDESAFEALDNALSTLDSLKVAELQNYFANDCVIAPIATRVDAVRDSQATAVISTALLNRDIFSGENTEEAQLVVIASLPDGSKKVAQTVASEQTVESVIVQFRRTLEAGNREYITEYDRSPGQQLYQWLIQPFEQDFDNVETLVFVNDGPLRGVPMAALSDGTQYLIENFAIATTPSLTLTNPERVERPTRLSALLMGVSDRTAVPARPFEPLPAVDEELTKVAQILPNSKILLNQELSRAALRETLANTDYRILHLATHGTFGFDPDDNFVVLGAKQEDAVAFNEVLTMGDLDAVLRETSDSARAPVELLTLTACDTARGDTRATLGLAGVAVRAGVRSAIATLWSVGDASSAELIADFYSNLQNSELTKAEALQRAQVAMIRSEDFVNRHPYRWAPFLLIGNWL